MGKFKKGDKVVFITKIHTRDGKKSGYNSNWAEMSETEQYIVDGIQNDFSFFPGIGEACISVSSGPYGGWIPEAILMLVESKSSATPVTTSASSTETSFKGGDIVCITDNTNHSSNKIGDVGVIFEFSSNSWRVEIPGGPKLSNVSLTKEIRHATLSEVERYMAGLKLVTPIAKPASAEYKFKTGDIVRLISNECSSRNQIGDVGKIVNMDSSGNCDVRVPGNTIPGTWSYPRDLALAFSDEIAAYLKKVAPSTTTTASFGATSKDSGNKFKLGDVVKCTDYKVRDKVGVVVVEKRTGYSTLVEFGERYDGCWADVNGNESSTGRCRYFDESAMTLISIGSATSAPNIIENEGPLQKIEEEVKLLPAYKEVTHSLLKID